MEYQLQLAVNKIVTENGKGLVHLPWVSSEVTKFYELYTITSVLPGDQKLRAIVEVP